MVFTISDFILLILLIFTVYFDITQKRIPNFLTLPAVLLGLIIFTVQGGFNGFIQGLSGFGVGIAVFFLFFALGVMGGGDVKLMGAIGALKGVEFILYTTIFTGIIGGVIAVVYMIISGQAIITLKKVFFIGATYFFKTLFFRLRNPYFNSLSVHFSNKLSLLKESGQSKKIYMPYGVAIAIGALIVLINLEVQMIPLILLDW